MQFMYPLALGNQESMFHQVYCRTSVIGPQVQTQQSGLVQDPKFIMLLIAEINMSN